MLRAGRFRIDGLIGAGGHGSVYRALDRTTGQPVALKVGRIDLTPAAKRRFEREAEALRRLHHPHVVGIRDVEVTATGDTCLVMDLIDGTSLAALLDDRERLAAPGVLTQAEAVSVGVQLLDGLAAVHRQRLVHRDVKPSNVLLRASDGGWRVTLVDFGVAWSADATLTQPGMVVGTPAYMAPEQCVGAPVDGRTDLYAVAALLYRAVAGAAPFCCDDSMSAMYSHVHVPPADLATRAATPVSAAFVATVMRGLAKEPRDRFADAGAMRAALAASGMPDQRPDPECGVATGDALPAIRPRAPDPATDPRPGTRQAGAERVPWMAVGAVAVVALVVALAALFHVRNATAFQESSQTPGQPVAHAASLDAPPASAPANPPGPGAAPVTREFLRDAARPPAGAAGTGTGLAETGLAETGQAGAGEVTASKTGVGQAAVSTALRARAVPRERPVPRRTTHTRRADDDDPRSIVPPE